PAAGWCAESGRLQEFDGAVPGWRRMIAPACALCYQSPRMFLLDLMGVVLTLITLGFLALAGYLTALRLLGEEAERDALALAVAALLAATAEAVGIALLLGGLGHLRLDLALAILVLLVVVLLRT